MKDLKNYLAILLFASITLLFGGCASLNGMGGNPAYVTTSQQQAKVLAPQVAGQPQRYWDGSFVNSFPLGGLFSQQNGQEGYQIIGNQPMVAGQQFVMVVGGVQKSCNLLDRGASAVTQSVAAGTLGYVTERLLNLGDHRVSAYAAVGGLIAGATFTCDTSIWQKIKNFFSDQPSEKVVATLPEPNGGPCLINRIKDGKTEEQKVVKNPNMSGKFCNELSTLLKSGKKKWEDL